MFYLLALITATAICVATIPVMWRLAPRLGMMDKPDPRKVHSIPVARVGGWGITLGALIPVAIWIPLGSVIASFIFGGLVLLAFGAWDDSHESGHYTKFVGQFIAVLPIVLYGGVRVEALPFIEGPLLPAFSIPFTVFAMVGMINAMNHSDGLDGLAGGEALMSLVVLAFLAYARDGVELVVVAAAAIGGILGFLRYNTHPARVFMGDSGSQFLGFTLAVLTVWLVQRVDPVLSPALPALMLGLPVIDIISVLAQRIHGGMNWFRATRNHIHHRLLNLGFDHYETVVVIYLIQAFFVTCAVLLRYDSDALILGLYLGVATAVFGLLMLGERRGWRLRRTDEASRISGIIATIKSHPLTHRGAVILVALAVPLFLVGGSLSVRTVPEDFGALSIVTLLILLVHLFLGNGSNSAAGRIPIYIAAMFIAYLTVEYPPVDFAKVRESTDLVFFTLLALSVAIAVRVGKDRGFEVTPTDYLIVFVVLAAGLIAKHFFNDNDISALLLKGVIVLYACELLIQGAKRRWNSLSLSSLATLGVLGARGLLF